MAKSPKTAEYWQNLQALGYSFRLNTLDDTIEVNDSPITDGLAAEIKNRMQDKGFGNVARTERAWVHLAHKNPYHPVTEYLESLQWSGQPAIAALAGYLQFGTDCTVNGINYGGRFLRRWMIGAVAKAFGRGQNFVLIFDGKQEIGKSTLARWLCPLPDLFIEGPINPMDKDYDLRLITHWIWEVSEFQQTMRRSERARLKDFVTRQVVTVRKPYGRYDLRKPALANFIGTTNPEGTGFLDDPSGNRRYTIVPLDGIDFDYSRCIDVNQLWAEAYQLYTAGEPWQLQPDEKNVAKVLQGDYEITTSLEEMVAMTYAADPLASDWVPSIDILTQLEISFSLPAGTLANSNSNKTELGRIMAGWGVTGKRQRVPVNKNGSTTTAQVQCYQGIKKL